MKHTLHILPLLALSTALWAVPAKRGPIQLSLADGQTAEVLLHGDEDFHYMTLPTGEWVEQRNGALVEVDSLPYAAVREQHAAAKARRTANATQTAKPLNMAPYGLVVLVNFSDVEMQAENNLAAWKEFFMSDHYTYNGATGSARQYFTDQSMGQYKPTFDVVGPIKLNNTQAYYGANSNYGGDKRTHEFAADAIRAAYDQCQIDFSKYDNDHDGYVDFVYFIYAGRGEADGGGENTIWPHTGWLGGSVVLGSKRINCYACSNELQAQGSKIYRDGIGAFCHEFSHVLGLPDHYATNGTTDTKLTGNWDIMTHGSYNNYSRTPAGYTAYERFFFGWLKPTLLNHPTTEELPALNTSNEAYIITRNGQCNFKGNDPNPSEFYMLENRQKTGWDKYIPGHGLLITKVDYKYNTWQNNTVNNNANAMGYDIIEADGLDGTRYYNGKQGDCFPYDYVNYYDPYDGMPLTSITEVDGIITFDFMGGSDPFSELAIQTLGETEKYQDYTQIVGLYDVAGHLIKSEPPFRNLAPGVYVIALSNGKKTRGVKIVIQ